MHIPNGFVSLPINAAAAALALATVGLAVARASKTLDEKKVPLLGVTAAFVFAAQMLNFPIAAGTSGHFLGAVLTAILLGPLSSCLVLALVLTIQCLLFADGGITALGTNIFNMGIVGGIGGFALFSLLRLLLPRSRTGFFIAAAVASWGSVVLGAAACAVELALSGTSPLHITLPAMAGVHMLIGIGEAIITCVVLSALLAARPDLVGAWNLPAAREVLMEAEG